MFKHVKVLPLETILPNVRLNGSSPEFEGETSSNLESDNPK
jgi:hypothetical protein